MSNPLPHERFPAEPASIAAGHNGLVPSPDGAEPESHPLREYLDVVRRHPWLVLLTTLLVFGWGAYGLLTKPPVYESAATVRSSDNRRSLTSGLGAAGGASQMSIYIDPLRSEIQVLRSRKLARGAALRAGLRLQPLSPDFPLSELNDVQIAPTAPVDTFTLRFDADAVSAVRRGNTVRARYGAVLHVGGASFSVRRPPAGLEEAQVAVVSLEEAADRVLGGLRALTRENTDVVDIFYTSSDPIIAQRVVNAVALEYQSQNALSAQEESRRRRIFLQEQLAATDAALRQSQGSLSGFRSRERTYSAREKFTAEQSGMATTEARREELASDRAVYVALLARLERSDAGADAAVRGLISTPGMAANPAVSGLYQQLIGYQTRRDSLTSGVWGSTARDPDVQRLDALIVTARNRLATAVREQLAVLDARIAALDQSRARTDAALGALPASEAEEVRLTEQVEGTRALAVQLREQYQRARLDEAVEMGNVTILDLAVTPGQPLGRARGPRLALFLLAGLVIGSGAAHLLERTNTTVRRRDEIEALVAVPVLASIPPLHQEVGQGNAFTRKAFPWWRRQAATRASTMVALAAPNTPGGEAFRMLRTSLFSEIHSRLHTVLVTSAAASEGKSTTSANLAVTYAQNGMRVLLVDCDLRRPQQHTIFGVPRSPGLADLVLGLVDWHAAVRRGPIENLFLLPVGELVPNPAELASSGALRATLRALREQFDIMILDAPPALVASEAAILGKMADGVVLVLRAGQTQRVGAQQASRQLRALGVRVIGAVLNDPDGKVVQGQEYYEYYS